MWIETSEGFINLDHVWFVRKKGEELRVCGQDGHLIACLTESDAERMMDALRAKLAIARDIMSVTRRMHGPNNGDLRIPVALSSCPGDD